MAEGQFDEHDDIGEDIEQAVAGLEIDPGEGDGYDEGADDPPEHSADGAPPQSIDPPAQWSAEHQEMFRQMPAQAQKFLMDRSVAMERAHTQRSEAIAPVRRAIEKWTPFVQSMGADTVQTIDQAMGYLHQLRSGTNEQRIGVLHELANMFGVQFQGAPDPQEQAEKDPLGIQSQIAAAIGPLAHRIEMMQNQGQQAAAQQRDQYNAQLRETVTSFVGAKDENGNLMHPHFREVAKEMAGMVQAALASGEQVDLSVLYDRACWATPSVREKILASQGAGNSRGFATGQAAALPQHRAGGSLTGSSRSSEAEQPDDLEEALRHNMRQLMG